MMPATQDTAPSPRTPGALRSLVTMEIQTRQAQRLVHGRRAESGKPPIIGLVRFAALLRPIWAGAAGDDPYADWWLIQIERELTAAREHLQDFKAHVERALAGAPAVNITVAQSLEPVKVDLVFNNPYAYHGAYLLGEYDALVRAVLTARHVGLMDRESAERLLQDGGRAVRRAYAVAHGYRFLAVTREDVKQGTAKAARARELMGELPQEVVDGTLRAAYAPEIRGRRSPSVSGSDNEEDNLEGEA